MKNTMRCLAIALVAAIGFSFAACDLFDFDDGSDGSLVPAAPTGLTASALTSNTIQLSWNSVSDAIGYNVYVSASSTGSYTPLVLGPFTINGTVDFNLSSNTTRYYRVTAFNIYGESGYSNIASATTFSDGDGGGTYNLGGTGPGGGKIFYYSEAGFAMTDNNEVCHYLEAAPNDAGTFAWASSGFTSSNITDTQGGIGNGRRNTARILNGDSNAPAARACSDYTNNGKSDWFLPSTGEIERLLRYSSGVVGNMLGTAYWTSNQYNNSSAYTWTLGATSSAHPAKSTLCNVRPIRAF